MENTMRAAGVLFCSALVTLTACSGREQVKSGYVGTSSMDQDQVMQLLNQQGYTDVTNLHKNGPDWIGAATKDGSTMTFDIDKNGKIHTK
jgi:hypothetical protein